MTSFLQFFGKHKMLSQGEFSWVESYVFFINYIYSIPLQADIIGYEA